MRCVFPGSHDTRCDKAVATLYAPPYNPPTYRSPYSQGHVFVCDSCGNYRDRDSHGTLLSDAGVQGTTAMIRHERGMGKGRQSPPLSRGSTSSCIPSTSQGIADLLCSQFTGMAVLLPPTAFVLEEVIAGGQP